MNPLVLLMIVSALSAECVGAKTLIITHAQTIAYDELGVAGEGTTALLRDPRFGRRVVLWGPLSGGFTFAAEVPSFTSLTSWGGEVPTRILDDSFTVAGGFFEICLQQTLFDLIRINSNRGDLKIEIKMDAVYMGISPGQMTLATYGKKLGQAELTANIRHHSDQLVKRLSKECSEILTDRGIEIALKINGVSITTYGQGARSVILNYVN